MKKILIADAGKASLVMISEVFKDNYPGIQVLVARNYSDAYSLAKEHKDIEAFIVDYHLPDKSGVSLALSLKKLRDCPILITALDDEDVSRDIEKNLKSFPDCLSWLKKPVNPEIVIAVVQRYCEGNIRQEKRYACSVPAIVKLFLNAPARLKKTQKTPTKVNSQASKKTVKSLEEKMTVPSHIALRASIENCSLGGIKLKICDTKSAQLTKPKELLRYLEYINLKKKTKILVPRNEDIAESEFTSFCKIDETKKKTTQKKSKSQDSSNNVKSSSGELLSQIASDIALTQFSSLNIKPIWSKKESGAIYVGAEFVSTEESSKFFEAVVESKRKDSKTPIFNFRFN